MFVTGRLAVAIAVGVVPLVLAGLAGSPAYAVLGVWLALCALLVGLDVLLAACPGACVSASPSRSAWPSTTTGPGRCTR